MKAIKLTYRQYEKIWNVVRVLYALDENETFSMARWGTCAASKIIKDEFFKRKGLDYDICGMPRCGKHFGFSALMAFFDLDFGHCIDMFGTDNVGATALEMADKVEAWLLACEKLGVDE